MDKMRISRKKKAQKLNSYASVDWEKAATLFRQNSVVAQENRSSGPSAKDILRILAGVGAVGLTLAFPGAAPVIGALVWGERGFPRWRVNKTMVQLQRHKFVSIQENSDGSTTVKITNHGMRRALTYQLDTLRLKTVKRWDKKWRVVIFDVPEKHRRLRDIFRMRLGQLGLYPLQESVFVSPYPCFEEIEFLRELYRVSFNVRYLLVEKIEDDSLLRSYFQLSS